MGIYIKDMEMPRNCYFCWLGHKCPKYEALLWNEINKERKADCPLVPVPAHGKLIDVDALEDNSITYYAIPALADAAIQEAELVIRLKDLDAAPTIIPAESLEENKTLNGDPHYNSSYVGKRSSLGLLDCWLRQETEESEI